jgi:DNA polymerase-3 subunit delta'
LVKIPLPRDEEVEKYLIEKNVEAKQAARFASVSSGNVREALRTLRSNEEDWLKIVRDWLNAIYQNKLENQTKWIEEVNEAGREKQKQLLEYFLHLIGISIRTKFMSKRDVKILDEGEGAFALTLGKMCGVEVMEVMAKEIDNAIYYIERNANTKLLFHALTIRFYHLIKEKQLILIH